MKDVTIDITDEQLGLFERRGLLAIHAMTSPDEIEALRILYDRVFEQEMGCTLIEMGAMLPLSDSPLLVMCASRPSRPRQHRDEPRAGRPTRPAAPCGPHRTRQ